MRRDRASDVAIGGLFQGSGCRTSGNLFISTGSEIDNDVCSMAAAWGERGSSLSQFERYPRQDIFTAPINGGCAFVPALRSLGLGFESGPFVTQERDPAVAKISQRFDL